MHADTHFEWFLLYCECFELQSVLEHTIVLQKSIF